LPAELIGTGIGFKDMQDNLKATAAAFQRETEIEQATKRFSRLLTPATNVMHNTFVVRQVRSLMI